MDEQIIRVFPRRTKATPDDSMSFVHPPGLLVPTATAVHVSVTFTYDIPRAEWLAKQWECVAPVTIGGPALNDPGGDFVAGRYLKPGYTFTSRGCPNKCWFCVVPKREGGIRELPIVDGWNVLDSNLLACSESHIRNVFAMLMRQKRQICFTGGLEAARLQDWHVDLLVQLGRKPRMYFAYDTPDDYEPLVVAGKKLNDAGFSSSTMRCFVLIGWPKDTISEAEKRLKQTKAAGFIPMAMLWKNKVGKIRPGWRNFQLLWFHPSVAGKAVGEKWVVGKEKQRRLQKKTKGFDLKIKKENKK